MEENKVIENETEVMTNESVKETVDESQGIELQEVLESSEEENAFDPKAFSNAASYLTDKDKTNEVETEVEENNEIWLETEDEKPEQPKVENVKGTLEEVLETPENSFNWEETGIEGVTNKEEFDKKISEYKEYESKVKKYETKDLESTTINKLRDFLKFDDETLLKKDLELQGFSGEQLETALDTYRYNNTTQIEAQKIRNTLNKAIKVEQNNVLKSQKDNEAKLQKDRDESVTQLKNHLNDTETMFGFKMAKDESQLKDVRENHFKYITSGEFLNDITDNNANLTEAAWLWKNRNTILKAMKNRGSQISKKELLDNIQRPEVPGTNRILDPSGKTDEFNPNKFLFNG